MERRKFISSNLAFGALAPAAYGSLGSKEPPTNKLADSPGQEEPVTIERVAEGDARRLCCATKHRVRCPEAAPNEPRPCTSPSLPEKNV